MKHIGISLNKKGKCGIWIILIVIVIVGLIWAYNSGYINILKEKYMLKDIYCENNIIPNRISINEGVANPKDFRMGYTLPDFASGWKDGIKIESPSLNSFDFTNSGFTVSCHKGSNEGENIDYFYCNNLEYYKTIQDVNGEGIIGKKIEENYNVSLILKPEGSWEFKEGIAIKSGENISKDFSELGIYLGNSGYLQTYGEAWAEKDEHFNQFNIYQNYSIISFKCSIK